MKLAQALIILSMIGILFGAAANNCDSNTPGNGTNQPFIGGSEGLTMAFQPGTPPDEIFDAGQIPFTIQVMVENVGEYDVLSDEAQVKIVGIEPGMFGTDEDGSTIESYLPQDLPGAAKLSDGTMVPGDQTVVSFPTEPDDDGFLYQPDLVGTDEIKISAEMCYRYKTKSTTQICIKDQVTDNLNNDKICVINEEKFPQNSGAPIHISALRETPMGQNSVQVTFKIEHVGTGIFFDPADTVPDKWFCQDSIQNPYENVVRVHVYFSEAGYDAPKIKCSGLEKPAEGRVQLFQGTPREISCTIKGDTNKKRIYQDLLHIDLEYQYMNYIEKPMIIRDVTKEDRTEP
jgi:hypothetical protein